MKDKKILVVDDDITSLDIVGYLFETGGFQVHRSADGTTALEIAAEVRPDAVVVDLMMPEVDGVETIKRLRANGFGGIPIIAFTAADESLLHEDALAAGCNCVLTKPVRPDKLLSVVTELLSRS